MTRQPSADSFVQLLISTTGKGSRLFCVLVLVFLWFLPQTGLSQQSSPAGMMTFSGVTQAIHDVRISPEVPGTVFQIHVKQGESVKKDQLLLELNHKLEQLEAERRQMIRDAQANLQSSQAQAAILKRLFQATQDVYSKTSAVSKDELERLRLEYEQARGRVAQLRVAEQREAIEYRIAQAQLQQKFLRAPFQGVVSKISIQEGERSLPNQPALRLVDINTCRFICNIEEKFTHSLHQGQELPLKIQSGSGWIERKGSLQLVSPVADPASSLVEIVVHFDNSDHAVQPGLPGRITLSAESVGN